RWARGHDVMFHLDGARLWEAAAGYERSPGDIAALFDSVYVSFYKGLGGVAGSMLAGPADFIAEARVWLRRHGGNLVHMYPYVIAARAGLRRRLGRFADWRKRAQAIARVLRSIPGVTIVPDPP